MAAYQTSTNGVITYFTDSIPGEGGSMINTNFRNLATNVFSGSQIAYAQEAGHAAYASQADWASHASYATYAYSISGGTSTSTSQIYGTAANPTLGDSSQLYANDGSHRLLVWGNCEDYQVSSYSTSYSTVYYPFSQSSTLANVNPFGPFFLKASLVFYRDYSYSTAIFADIEIFGWNLEIIGTKVLRAWDISGSSVDLLISTDFSSTSSSPMIWVKISNQQLQFSGYPASESDGYHTVHARVENVWPSSGDWGSYGS